MSWRMFSKTAAAMLWAVFLFLIIRALSALVLYYFMDHKFYFWSNYIQLSAEKNYFFAFGLPMPIWATLTISAVGLGLLNFLFLVLQFNRAWFVIGYAFIMSGGVSNFLERLRLGYVWDYLVVQWAGLRGVWNLADFFILIGIGIWAIGFIRQNFDVNFYGH